MSYISFNQGSRCKKTWAPICNTYIGYEYHCTVAVATCSYNLYGIIVINLLGFQFDGKTKMQRLRQPKA